MNENNMDAEIPQRAVSLYGANEGMDDFPVLKAFQQYIDAEQEKARKRIFWLGAFFVGILVVVVIVFMVLLHGINTRNQALSDRLFEYAVKEADRRQSAPAATPSVQNEAALKAMTDTLVSIQKKLQDTDARPVTQSAIDVTQERRLREDAEKIENAKRYLEQEKKRLTAEKERLHQIEIEQQRRKLYPELYETESDDTSFSRRRASPSRNRAHTLTDDDIRDIIREAYPEDARTTETPPASRKQAESPSVQSEEDTDAEEEAIEYFKDDEYTIPIEVKGSSKKVKFALPIE